MTVAVVNVLESSLARESEHVIGLGCGPEVSVASTKVVTNMLLAGLLVAHVLNHAADAAFGTTRAPAGIAGLPYAVQQCLALSE